MPAGELYVKARPHLHDEDHLFDLDGHACFGERLERSVRGHPEYVLVIVDLTRTDVLKTRWSRENADVFAKMSRDDRAYQKVMDGSTRAYRSQSYRDPRFGKPQCRREYLGRVGPETGEIIPKKPRCRRAGAGGEATESHPDASDTPSTRWRWDPSEAIGLATTNRLGPAEAWAPLHTNVGSRHAFCSRRVFPRVSLR